MNTALNWFDRSSNANANGDSLQMPGRNAELLQRLNPATAIGLLAGAIAGGAAALVALGLAALLPAGQALNGLAALAAGVAVTLLWLSLDDLPRARAFLRSAVAIAGAVLAYQSLGAGWVSLGFAWVLPLAWVVMDWIDSGINPLRLGLVVSFGLLGLFSFSYL